MSSQSVVSVGGIQTTSGKRGDSKTLGRQGQSVGTTIVQETPQPFNDDYEAAMTERGDNES